MKANGSGRLYGSVLLASALFTACATPGDPLARNEQAISGTGTVFDNPLPPDAGVGVGLTHNATVSLALSAPGNNAGSCSGVLISPRHILTAAHCFYNWSEGQRVATSVTVKFGPSANLGPDGSVGGSVTISSTSSGVGGVPGANCWMRPGFVSHFLGTGHGDSCWQTWVPNSAGTPASGSDDQAVFEIPTSVLRTVATPSPIDFPPDNSGNHPASQSRVDATIGDHIRIAGYSTGTRYTTPASLTYPDCSGIVAEPYVSEGDSGGPWFTVHGLMAKSRHLADAREWLLGTIVTSGCPTPANEDWLNGHLGDPTSPPNANGSPTRWRYELEGVSTDNCPGVINPDQIDSDGDGRGDACDLCPNTNIAAGDDPPGTIQTNCNALAESATLPPGPAWGDACDPMPCATIAALNGPLPLNGPAPTVFGSAHRTLCGRTSGSLTSCSGGVSTIGIGMAPRVATASTTVAGTTWMPPSGPSSTASPLVTATRRCFCFTPTIGANHPASLTAGLCYQSSAHSACLPVATPNGSSDGSGWVVADLTIGPNSVTTGIVRDTSYRADTVYAPTLMYPASPSGSGRSGEQNAYLAWRTVAGALTWSVYNWYTPSAKNPFPSSFVFSGATAPSINPPPNDAVFAIRAQAPSAVLGLAQQNAQLLQDSYLPTEVTVPTPYTEVVYVLQAWDQWWFLHGGQWLHPSLSSDPTTWTQENAYVGRTLLGIDALDSQTTSTLQEAFWSGSPSTDAIRGVAITQANVRTAQMVNASYTQGAVGQRPIYAAAAYGAGPADPQGWADVFAFGGHTVAGVDQAALFRATHTTANDGTATYTWSLLSSSGGPSAREHATVAVNGTATSVYVIGGYSGSTVYGDVWRYNISAATWTQLSLTTAMTARYDAAVAIKDDWLYVGGGVGTGTTYLGDLIQINGVTGFALDYGNALPSGGLPNLSFDDHGDGLIFGGGYDASGWYRDLWSVTLGTTTATNAFIHDFATDGMIATSNYAIVGDMQHGAYWGVPGYSAATGAKGTYFFDSGTGTTGGGPQSLIVGEPAPPTAPLRAPTPAGGVGRGILIRPGTDTVGPQ